MAAPLITFGVHEFDADTGTLRRGGERCRLQSQPAQLLALLIARAGEVVTREQIREQLWGTTVVEYDQSINFAIRQIRIALGPDAVLLQTVPRRGYRFVGEAASTVAKLGHRPSRTAPAMAAAVLVALASGFGVGVVTRDTTASRFVYDHLVHPDRCPYMRFLFRAHRNS